MTRFAAMIGAAAAFVAVFASPAEAGWKVDSMLRIAQQVAGPVNDCPGGVPRVEWRDWRTQGEKYKTSYAWAPLGQCVLVFNKRYTLPWPTFCKMGVHEYIHQRGYVGNDPNDRYHDVFGTPSVMAHQNVTVEDFKWPHQITSDWVPSYCEKYPRGHSERDDPSSDYHRGN